MYLKFIIWPCVLGQASHHQDKPEIGNTQIQSLGTRRHQLINFAYLRFWPQSIFSIGVLFLIGCSSSPPLPNEVNPSIENISILPIDPTKGASTPDKLKRPHLQHYPSVESQSVSGVYPPKFGSSPFGFDRFGTPSDSYVVTDRGSSLDQYLYRPSSPISIPIISRRFVGDVAKLKENQLISNTVQIIIPSFDVDAQTPVSFDCDGDGIDDQLRPELDQVYFNGKLIGSLRGGNDVWFMNRFNIPIEDFRFPTQAGQQNTNTLTIQIDVLNQDVVLSSGQIGCDVWAVEIDWAAISYQVTSPIIFVPGFFGIPDIFTKLPTEGTDRKAYTTRLNEIGIPNAIVPFQTGTGSLPDAACLGNPFGSIQATVRDLRNRIQIEAERWGTDAIHVIAYSKGGRDARALLQNLRQSPLLVNVGLMGGQLVLRPLEIASLATHATPHNGTVVADYNAATLSAIGIFTDLCTLTIQYAPKINRALGRPRIPSITLSSDADRNGDEKVGGIERGIPWSDNTATFYYRLIRDTARVDVQVLPTGGTPITSPVFIPNTQPQTNDTVSSVASSRAMPGRLGGITYVGLGSGNTSSGLDHDQIVPNQYPQTFVVNQGRNGALQWRLR